MTTTYVCVYCGVLFDHRLSNFGLVAWESDPIEFACLDCCESPRLNRETGEWPPLPPYVAPPHMLAVTQPLPRVPDPSLPPTPPPRRIDEENADPYWKKAMELLGR